LTVRFIQERLTPLDIAKGMDLTHLKRVRRAGQRTEEGHDIIDVVLCAESTLSKAALDDIVTQAVQSGIPISPRLEKVSRWPAYTMKQLAEFKVLWPVTLRKDSARSIKNPEKEAIEMRKYILQTIELTNQRNSTHSTDLPIAALLTDPRTSKVLLTAHDTRVSSGHPLQHAVMNLLTELPSLLPANQSAEVQLMSNDEEEQYYASMYDVYITHEPCTMCCMALVHSRVRRLIFWRGTARGARQLGWMKGDDLDGLLNHRYMCFEGIHGALGEDITVAELDDDVCA